MMFSSFKNFLKSLFKQLIMNDKYYSCFYNSDDNKPLTIKHMQLIMYNKSKAALKIFPVNVCE